MKCLSLISACALAVTLATTACTRVATTQMAVIDSIGGGKITMSNYQSLKTGMSYDNVVALLGEKGQELSSSDIGGSHTAMYMWQNPSGANMNAMFQNGKLITKAQMGLQ